MIGGTLLKRLLARMDIGVYYLSQMEVDPLAHNSAESMQDYYANNSRARRRFLENRHAFFRHMIDLSADAGVGLKGQRIADAGCGTGELLAFLEETATPASLTGYEFAESAREAARRACPEANILPLDLYETCDDSHDVVFCLEVLEHLLHPERALANLLHMTRPGGHLILTVPDGRADNYGGHIQFWSPLSWKTFLEKNGDARWTTGVLHKGEIRVNWGIVQKPEGT